MAGHSHYKNMARHKAIVDAKRGKVFSKLGISSRRQLRTALPEHIGLVASA